MGRGPFVTHPDDGCVLTNHMAYHIFLPSLMEVCPRHGPWVTVLWLSDTKAGREFPTLEIWGLGAKGEHPDTKMCIIQEHWKLAHG